MPDLDTLLKVIQCDLWVDCKKCPYGYQYWDESGDYGYWRCNENRVLEETVFFLSLYQKLIQEQEQNK